MIEVSSPVAPTWAVPIEAPISPAFGTPNTIVSVPPNRRMAIVGMLDAELPENNLDRDGIAAVNSMTAKYANQLYSAEPDFVWIMRDYSVGGIKDLREMLEN